ncbi:gamma-glutamyltransferase [Roseomonas sp. CCTCC AB2023176]|uniref:gamma-glutamyltransferase n=1 Tax=Roseomonas sp. CCTCC AB2023176 TaxID=3342640 RepID=UPI0035E3A13C
MRLVLFVALLVASLPAWAQAPARSRMVAAAHPLAAEAGLEALRAGGSAVDAAVAVQAVLTLVEPQSSGIGGGALILHWSAADRAVSAWDGRETAPAAARPELFLRPDGTPCPSTRPCCRAAASACPVPSQLWKPHTGGMGNCPGPASGIGRSRWRKRASRSRRG